MGWAGVNVGNPVPGRLRTPSKTPNEAPTDQNRCRFRPKTPHLNPVSKSLWQGPTLRLGLAWTGRGWAEFGLGTKNKAPEPRLQDSENAAARRPQQAKNLGCGGLGCTELMGWCGLAGLSLAGLGWAGAGWAGLGCGWGGLRWGGLGWAGLGWAGRLGAEKGHI